MIIRQIRILRTNGKADGNGATWPSPGRGLGVGDRKADCQGRRYLRTEKAAMTCMRTVTERSDLALSRERVGCG